ncbi:Rieske domain-containing protein isoform X2 [Cololabis saira]|uniref:Rieske domain-containing protein isoform X2 n=1 Tax=Cololabis saira TaxID=129043 RepID=UPI002AD41447|nr:Rieske domain-containing protein isoform X2 [Cololabis saira]
MEDNLLQTFKVAVVPARFTEPMEGKQQSSGDLHFVGRRDELIEAKRSCRTIDDRDILIVYHQGAFYAMDSYCYHAGGKLQNGDIEHKYKISLAEGEGFYKGTDTRKKPPVRTWFSKGVKQRTHTVTETNGEIYVRLSGHAGWIDSDYYQGELGKEQRAKADATEEETPETDSDE